MFKSEILPLARNSSRVLARYCSSLVKKHPIPQVLATDANITAAAYVEKYPASIADGGKAFWSDEARSRLDWYEDFHTVCSTQTDVRKGPIKIEWYKGGKLNVSANCVDRHVEDGRGSDIAIIWEGDDASESRKISYNELQGEVSRLANVLREELHVKKGDRVSICMPMIPETAIAMLACARIGAVHSIIFGGFSAEAVSGRVVDCQSKVVITADFGMRGGKEVPLKSIVDDALDLIPKGQDTVQSVLVVDRALTSNLPSTAKPLSHPSRDKWYHETMANASSNCTPEKMDSEDPLFILYTSGSTGKPKGVVHSTAGYLVGASLTHETSFDHKRGDIFWCTADCGWITGHTYTVYGPLANGGTTLMFEGVPTFPSPSRLWEIVDRYNVNCLYTAPTALRALMAEGDEYVTNSSRASLRVLGTVGEPINKTAWDWYNEVVGNKNCAIVDTWWQTETGCHMLTPLPGATETKPGSCCAPHFGIVPQLVDDETGEVLEGNPAEGALVIAQSWPSQMRTIYGDHERFENAYYGDYPGKYFTGDRARRDEDGYLWITGRTDDVINVSGHRLGTAEVETAIMTHEGVAKAAVVGFPHDVKGTGIHAFVVPKPELDENQVSQLDVAVKQAVRKVIGPVASPDKVQVSRALPETRSGKTMRRILRKIAEGESDLDAFGDVSTLLDPTTVEELIEGRI
eukprot:g4043.t1